MKSTLKDTKKPEDNAKLLESIRKQGSNKQCFDCGEKVEFTNSRERLMWGLLSALLFARGVPDYCVI